MKDSGIPWVGEIPAEWQVEPMRQHFKERKRKNLAGKEDNLLSLSYGNIIRKPIDSTGGLLPANFLGYNIIEGGDIVFRMTDLQNDQHSLRSGLSPERGIITSAYITTIPYGETESRFFNYLFRAYDQLKVFYNMGSGVRQGINYDVLKRMPLVCPSLTEQQRIADYLDERCAAIDGLKRTIEDEVEALRRLRKATIHRAVTKGLDEGVPMQDSGYHYIGNICKDWQLVRFRYLCDIDTGDHDTQDKEPDGEYPMYVRSPNVERSNTYTFDCEGILMAGDGAGAGRVFHHANGRYAVHQRVYCFHNFQQRIVTDYLYYYLSEHFGYRMDMGSAQSTVPSVRLHMIQDFPVPLPDCDLQQRIADYLDERCAAIDSVIDTRTKQLARLDDYRKALIFAYVTGKKEVPTHA